MFESAYKYPVDRVFHNLISAMEELRNELLQNGFVRIPRSVFSLDEHTVLDDLRTEFEKLFAGDYETGIYPDEIHWRQGISKENVTKEICNGWKASRKIERIVCGTELGKLACSLMMWSNSRIGQDDIIHKPPRSNPVGFHQDGAYISDNFLPREGNCLTMWIALDDADAENGALQYAPGSHRWPNHNDNISVGDVSASSFHVGDKEDHLTPLRNAAQVAGLDSQEVLRSVETVPVRAGEMVVHHQQVWHGSGPNVSITRPRRALVAHLINGEVQWRHEPKPHYIYGRYYIRGEDVPREDFFPVTYSTIDSLARTPWLDKA
jgi:phytanoyl-CoA hydroxylase